MHHDTGDHFTGGHWMLTGRGEVSGAATAGKYPFFGAIAAKVAALANRECPLMQLCLTQQHWDSPGYFGGNYLGTEQNPFETDGDPNADNYRVANLGEIGGLTIDRLGDRRSLNTSLDRIRREADRTGLLQAMNRFDQQAFDLVTSSAAREAFRIESESSETRARYGRNSWGQSVLLARRLVEAGSSVVTCHFGGWDTHWNHQSSMESYLPKVDMAVSSLFADLDQRGLLDKVMVVVCGEFGRTPKMNDGGNGGPPLSQGTPGRDHWGNALSVLIGGGGLKGGQVIGATNRLGEVQLNAPSAQVTCTTRSSMCWGSIPLSAFSTTRAAPFRHRPRCCDPRARVEAADIDVNGYALRPFAGSTDFAD